MNELPQLTAAMRELCITPRAQREILATCDAALAAQIRADAERLPLGVLVMRWRHWPDCGSLFPTAHSATEPALESP